jgi:hypothetical protein
MPGHAAGLPDAACWAAYRDRDRQNILVPQSLALIGNLPAAAMLRNPETANSRPMINTAIQPGSAYLHQ